MDKRVLKRHKRQVERAKQRVKISEPDVRTEEEIKAAREASRPTADRKADGNARNAPVTFRSSRAPGSGSAAKTDV